MKTGQTGNVMAKNVLYPLLGLQIVCVLEGMILEMSFTVSHFSRVLKTGQTGDMSGQTGNVMAKLLSFVLYKIDILAFILELIVYRYRSSFSFYPLIGSPNCVCP